MSQCSRCVHLRIRPRLSHGKLRFRCAHPCNPTSERMFTMSEHLVDALRDCSGFAYSVSTRLLWLADQQK